MLPFLEAVGEEKGMLPAVSAGIMLWLNWRSVGWGSGYERLFTKSSGSTVHTSGSALGRGFI